jgi:hypothetical protein
MDNSTLTEVLAERLSNLVDAQTRLVTRLDHLADQLIALNTRLTFIEAVPAKDYEARMTKLESTTGVPTKEFEARMTKMEAGGVPTKEFEARMTRMESVAGQHTQRWERIADLVIKIIGGTLAAYFLYKFGLK